MDNKKISKLNNEYFNPEKGLKIASGNIDLQNLLLKKFETLNFKFIENFKSLLKKNDYNEARIQIHTLKNKASNIGAEKLHKIAEKLENEIDNSKTILENSYLVINLEEVLIKTINEINVFLKENISNQEEKDSLAMFDEFIKLLHEDFFEAKIFFELQESNFNLIKNDDFNELKYYMSIYEEEEALRIANRIKKYLISWILIKLDESF